MKLHPGKMRMEITVGTYYTYYSVTYFGMDDISIVTGECPPLGKILVCAYYIDTYQLTRRKGKGNKSHV